MLLLTDEQHIKVLKKLIEKARELKNSPRFHEAGIEYTSLMYCFLLHNLSCAESLICLLNSFTSEWFPVTIGYTIVRPMFEIDIHSHYISLNPKENALRYIKFGKVTLYNQMMAVFKTRNSKNRSWSEAMNYIWEKVWKSKQKKVVEDYNNVIPIFSKQEKNKKIVPFHNWTGKSLRQMAKEVNHEEAYDIFYSELSSFTHVDINSADRFLHCKQNEVTWSMRSNEYDRGNVFRFADIFLTCFLEHFGRVFDIWTEQDVEECWRINKQNCTDCNTG